MKDMSLTFYLAQVNELGDFLRESAERSGSAEDFGKLVSTKFRNQFDRTDILPVLNDRVEQACLLFGLQAEDGIYELVRCQPSAETPPKRKIIGSRGFVTLSGYSDLSESPEISAVKEMPSFTKYRDCLEFDDDYEDDEWIALDVKTDSVERLCNEFGVPYLSEGMTYMMFFHTELIFEGEK